MSQEYINRILSEPFKDKYELVKQISERGLRSSEISRIHNNLFGVTLDRTLGRAELFGELLYSIKEYCCVTIAHEKYWGVNKKHSALNLATRVDSKQIIKNRVTH